MSFKKNSRYNIKIVCVFALMALVTFSGIFVVVKRTYLTYKSPVNKMYGSILNSTIPVVNGNNKFESDELKRSFSKIIGMNSKESLSVLGKEIAYLKANSEYEKLENAQSCMGRQEEHVFNEFTLNDDQVLEENESKSDGNMSSAPVFSKDLKKNMPSEPEVLIYHTHTCESYVPYGINTKDQTKSIVAVGNELKNELDRYGVNVIHDNTVHDVVDYDNAYKHSRVTLKKYLQKHGDFKLIIDLHRDSVPRDMVTTTINGESVARFEFVMVRKNPHSDKNIQLTEKLKAISNKLYPGNKSAKSYNRGTWKYDYGKNLYSQDLSNNAMLIEIGSHLNTFDEAKASSKYLARIIAEYINGKN